MSDNLAAGKRTGQLSLLDEVDQFGGAGLPASRSRFKHLIVRLARMPAPPVAVNSQAADLTLLSQQNRIYWESRKTLYEHKIIFRTRPFA
jgi:hypothetical protein